MRSIVLVLSLVGLAVCQDFQCTREKVPSGGVEHCVFRDVTNVKAGAKFSYPSDGPKPTHVAFQSSVMKHLPRDFLQLAGSELKVLRVEDCGLESITVTSGMEELYAKDNTIEKVIVHQSGSDGPLRILDLSGNQLRETGNITRGQNMEILNLNSNSELFGGTLDFEKFTGLNKLRELYLAHNEINYIDNRAKITLPSLELLDLSHNNIIPSDLEIDRLYPFTKLQTLRLNDNLMANLDYNHLLNIKSLKTVYLNGNEFNCGYVDTMLKHLQKNGLETPAESYSCRTQWKGICCTGTLPTEPAPPRPVTPEPTTVTPGPSKISSTTGRSTDIPPPVQPGEDGTPSWMWIVIGVVVAVVLAVSIGLAIFLHKKRNQRYGEPPEQYNMK